MLEKNFVCNSIIREAMANQPTEQSVVNK